jgi:hypothetical protein
MQRITHLDALAQRHGLSLIESLALHVVSVFATDEATAARFIAKILKGSTYADADCRLPILRCVREGWLRVSQHGMLVLTKEGILIEQKIANELESDDSIRDAG